MMKNPFGQFYKKAIKERKAILKSLDLYNESNDQRLSDEVFDQLIENYLTTYEVPLGIAPDFLIDGSYYHVPMATEESSVIAGASHAAKIIERHGGFKVTVLNRQMIGQIIFKHVKNPGQLKSFIEGNLERLFELAKKAHPHIHELGGGLKSIDVDIKTHDFVTLYAKVDTLDAMGANTVNTILESLATYISSNQNVSVLMSILSNLATESLVSAKVTINPINLKNSETIAYDIADANLYASIDPYRAATHNKGIMNGVTAVVLASGNDTRAIEASAHAYASISGKYQPLTKWYVDENKMLSGEITIPLAIGTVGGSISSNPKVKLVHQILGVKKAIDLMKVIACVGLAQNFAALYALTTDGIQKGHMRLHARHIALQAGATQSEMDDVINYLVTSKVVTLDQAKQYLEQKRSQQ